MYVMERNKILINVLMTKAYMPVLLGTYACTEGLMSVIWE